MSVAVHPGVIRGVPGSWQAQTLLGRLGKHLKSFLGGHRLFVQGEPISTIHLHADIVQCVSVYTSSALGIVLIMWRWRSISLRSLWMFRACRYQYSLSLLLALL